MKARPGRRRDRPPALSSGSPVATYHAISASLIGAKRTVVRSIADRSDRRRDEADAGHDLVAAAGQAAQHRVRHRPAKRACRGRGPHRRPAVSAAEHAAALAARPPPPPWRGRGAPPRRARLPRAAATRRRRTATRKGMPRAARMRARRGDAEARTSAGSSDSASPEESEIDAAPPGLPRCRRPSARTRRRRGSCGLPSGSRRAGACRARSGCPPTPSWP